MEPQALLEAVVAIWADSVTRERFNGVRLEQLHLSIPDDEIHGLLVGLIRARKLDCLAPPILNPHIKRFPAPDVETQLGYLDVVEKYHTVLYPTREVIQKSIDLAFLNSKPFSRQLAEGAPQLEPLFFEVAVLDRYRLDPRYSFHFNGYTGHMSVRDSEYEQIAERDRVFVESFGLGLDEQGHPVVAVFLRYLAYLTAEHQQYWNSYTVNRPARIHPNYYRPSILGEFWTNNGALAALRLEIEKLNELSEAVWGHRLFRLAVPPEPHYTLTPFMKPTKAELLTFAHELDKLISENLDKTAVRQMLSDAGVILDSETDNLGTLKLLETFLFSGLIKWEDEAQARAEIMGPLRELRKLRQKPAHSVVTNKHDPEVYDRKRRLLGDIVFALGSILMVLKKHPKAPQIDLPEWFTAADVEIL
jgi:hypothetical protein